MFTSNVCWLRIFHWRICCFWLRICSYFLTYDSLKDLSINQRKENDKVNKNWRRTNEFFISAIHLPFFVFSILFYKLCNNKCHFKAQSAACKTSCVGRNKIPFLISRAAAQTLRLLSTLQPSWQLHTCWLCVCQILREACGFPHPTTAELPGARARSRRAESVGTFSSPAENQQGKDQLNRRKRWESLTQRKEEEDVILLLNSLMEGGMFRFNVTIFAYTVAHCWLQGNMNIMSFCNIKGEKMLFCSFLPTGLWLTLSSRPSPTVTALLRLVLGNFQVKWRSGNF